MAGFGSPNRTRTYSLLVNSRMLYLLLVTYITISSNFERGDVGPSPDFRHRRLPAELTCFQRAPE